MTPLSELLAQGSGHAWLFVPSAILLGALHGLEPGHSKTMMAAFIVAVRGTVMQAVLLGLSATVSHTAIVWIVALGGQYFGQEWASEANEGYFQLGSAVLIILVAVWMLWRTWADQHAPHDHHQHHHDHHHDEVPHVIATGAGDLSLEVYETNAPPRFRLRAADGAMLHAAEISLVTVRADGGRQSFDFVAQDGFVESVQTIPEPHSFTAILQLRHGAAIDSHEVVYAEHDHHHHHHHDHDHLDLGEADDAHARAHAQDIQQRFAGRSVTTGQIVMFGLTGGLIPCPSAITVLLLCLQLKQISLGAVLVLSFSVGLAITMISAGVIAALGVRHLGGRLPGFGRFARYAPYASGVMIILVGVYTGYLGFVSL
jgi:nickel/cobalt transporter (NicO) family protein